MFTAIGVALLRSEEADSVPVVIFFLLFALAGLYFSFGRLVQVYIARRRTRYVVTDRRVLQLGGWDPILGVSHGGPLPEATIETYLDIAHEIGPDGVGTLRFGGSARPLVQFLDIADGARVSALVTRLRDERIAEASDAAPVAPDRPREVGATHQPGGTQAAGRLVFDADEHARAFDARAARLAGIVLVCLLALASVDYARDNDFFGGDIRAVRVGAPQAAFVVVVGVLLLASKYVRWSALQTPYQVWLTDEGTLVCRRLAGTMTIPIRDIFALTRRWSGEGLTAARELEIMHSGGRVIVLRGWTFDKVERFIAALTKQNPAIIVEGEW